MRPRPATWTAFGLAVHSVTLFHARGMGGVHLVRALRKAPVAMHSADRHLRSELRKSICNTTVAGGQSCRLWRTLWRRPQRPGNQSRAETRSWRIPPGDSPSRITRHRRLCRNALAGHTEHLARMSALCARHALRFKGKSRPRCAETVDAVDSLWKVVENQDSTVQTLCEVTLVRGRPSVLYLMLPLRGNGV
jgi:hypothetical protein